MVIDMWSQIKEFFKELPAQQRVAQLLFERGFQVREDGKVVSGGIEIPHTQIAKEVGGSNDTFEDRTEEDLQES